MNDTFWLSDEQMARLEPFFPTSHGRPCVDVRRVPSGIIFINGSGLCWIDTPAEYGPVKTFYNRWKRWGDMGVCARVMLGLSKANSHLSTLMIDATSLKPNRTASSLGLKRGARAAEHEASCRER